MRSTSAKSDSDKRVPCRLAVVAVVCFATYLLGGSYSVASAQELHPGTDYPRTVDPWEVILYEHPDFSGAWMTCRMEPGTRQKLVQVIDQAMEDKVSSIQVGSKVCVEIFEHRYFAAGSASGRKTICQSRRELGSIDLNDKLSSFIVFPREAAAPFGVSLYNGGHSAFFPLPEADRVLVINYSELGNVDSDKNADTLSIHNSHVEVTLFEARSFEGEAVKFPGAEQTGEPGFYRLSNYGWSGRAASLVLSWKGPLVAMGPPSPPPVNPRVNAPPTLVTEAGIDLPGRDYKSFFLDGGPEVCEKACAGDPKCQAFTWVKPGVQGEKAACWLKSSVPTPVNDSNCVSGYKGMRQP